MEFAKVSIIIPVYKAEKTLRKCLDSIVAQTLSEWEGILVDDGSPDACGQICDEYAAKDGRFRVIHQANRGVAMARQIGVDAARGEYVIHADADDWTEPTMLEELYGKAKKTSADVVICDYFVNDNRGERYVAQRPINMEPRKILDEMFHRLHGSLCNKLVTRACYTKYYLHFYEDINYCEDVLIWVQLLRYDDVKVAYLPQAFYHYVQHPMSITNNYTIETLNAQKRFITALSGLLSENSYPVVKSKGLAKELTYRNAILSDVEFDKLYPEIKSAHHDNLAMRIMYRLAFTGHHSFANTLRKVYRIVH